MDTKVVIHNLWEPRDVLLTQMSMGIGVHE
jgi:hypothetical protein